MVQKTKKAAKKPSVWKKIITMAVCIAIPLVVGFSSSLLTMGTMEQFGQFNQPPLSPPAWLFPVAWTILYILMGVAFYFIWTFKARSKKEQKLKTAEIVIYFVQLGFNFFWSLLFFAWQLRFLALAWLILMWLMIIALILMTKRNSRAAMWCLVPYILWCSFAMYLNCGVAILN